MIAKEKEGAERHSHHVQYIRLDLPRNDKILPSIHFFPLTWILNSHAFYSSLLIPYDGALIWNEFRGILSSHLL